jgi:hypothetical protein
MIHLPRFQFVPFGRLALARSVGMSVFVLSIVITIMVAAGEYFRCGSWEGKPFAQPGSPAAHLCRAPGEHWHMVRTMVIWLPWGSLTLLAVGGLWAVIRYRPGLYHRLLATTILATLGIAVIWVKIATSA